MPPPAWWRADCCARCTIRDDGRGRLLHLTRKGAAVHQGVVPLACELEEQLAEGMSRAEWSSLLKALDKLSAHALGFEGTDHGTSVD